MKIVGEGNERGLSREGGERSILGIGKCST